MSPDQLLAFAIFSFVATLTPGPNNAMLLSSGVHYGIRRTLPHILGINLGYPAMIFVVGLGLGTLFQTHPIFYTILRYISAAYLLYLAWKIANAGTVHGKLPSGKPMTLKAAAIFQWINPKAWVGAVSTITAYTPRTHFFHNLILICLLQIIILFPCLLTWASFGTGLRRFLSHPRAARIFNISMALLLILSLVPIFRETAGK